MSESVLVTKGNVHYLSSFAAAVRVLKMILPASLEFPLLNSLLFMVLDNAKHCFPGFSPKAVIVESKIDSLPLASGKVGVLGRQYTLYDI